eukprot:CAMPEP_0184673188 /NCGR_PEP_ID=MMETSP0308-20130426/86541_2 /TAXON_ID=38269 /ORGANISM="Gloeochaete witrockiana, Strain SAG 46.84" /LENGTH=95 /DNA_ID=CAMNT_0027120645 /DNA_START=1672 /DNA_END=1960 /DNA_ORIENTATION=-
MSDVLKCKADVEVMNNTGILKVAKRLKVYAAPDVGLAVIVTYQLNVTKVDVWGVAVKAAVLVGLRVGLLVAVGFGVVVAISPFTESTKSLHFDMA